MRTVQEHKNVQCTMNNVQWKKVRLGEVCVPSSEKYNPLTENIFQYCIEMENINQESGTINGKSDITKLLSLKTKFHRGEVLYGKLRPYLKKYWLADFDGACSTEIWVLKNSENIDNQFLYYLFQSDCINRIANQSSGTKMPRADWKFMEKQTVSIPFKNDKPDLSTQHRIAAILASADKVIAATQKLIAKYKQMKQGMMEDLLKPKEGWKMVKLGEYIELQGGFAFSSRSFSDSGVPLIRIGDITSNGLNTCSAVKLPNNYLIEYKDFALDINDTVIAMSGATTGKCTLVVQKDLPALLNQRVGRFKVKNNSIDKLFLYYIVSNNMYQQKLLIDAAGGAQPNVSPKQIESVLCYIPTLSDGKPNLTEQRRIAAILMGIDAKIAAEEKVLEKYEKVKKGLLEKLLNE